MQVDRRRVGRRAVLRIAAGAAGAAMLAACGESLPMPTPTPNRYISQTRTAVDQGLVVATAVGGAAGARPPSDLRGRLALPGVSYAPMPAADGAKALADSREILSFIRDAVLLPVAGKVAPTNAALIEAMRGRAIDLALLSPFAYILAHESVNAQPLVQGEAGDGRPATNRGFLIAAPNSGITTPPLVKGKTVAFVDQTSLAGYLVPAYTLLTKFNLRINVDYMPVFAGSVAGVYQAVTGGKADAGAMPSDQLEQGIGAGTFKQDAIRILDTTFDIPGAVVAVRDSVPNTDQQTLQSLFLTLSEQPRGAKVYTDFVLSPPAGSGELGPGTVKIRRGDDSLYNELRKIPATLGVDIRTLAR